MTPTDLQLQVKNKNNIKKKTKKNGIKSSHLKNAQARFP